MPPLFYSLESTGPIHMFLILFDSPSVLLPLLISEDTSDVIVLETGSPPFSLVFGRYH